MDIANAIGAYNQLQGWHLVIFAVITVAIARPEWVRAIYNRLIGNGRKPVANGWATKADFQTIATRLDNHEAECVKRNAVIQRDIDGLKTDFAFMKSDVEVMKSDIAELKHDTAALKSDVAELKHDTAALKTDVSNIKSSIAAMRTDLKWVGQTLGYRNRGGEEFSDA